ncbi:uncharacterized protein LOC134452159 [Engraulis encrasicolus]|uniref:uncharacterized protein LOC134452159 n=1 Tax=Engraulis encrasicolus TaxID=184585 RepID=UPI002FD25972
MDLSNEDDAFLPFARKSKEVQRTSEEESMPEWQTFEEPSVFPRYSEEFWDRIVHQPSDESPQFSYFTSPGELSEAWGPPSKRRRAEALGFGAQQLPSPEELLGRRPRVKRSAEVERTAAIQPRVAAVLNHIGDLKRRQGSVELLKKDTWFSQSNDFEQTHNNTAWGKALTEVGAEQLLEPIFRDELKDTPMESEGDTQTHSAAALNTPMPGFAGSDQMRSLAPGENPMMAFVLASVDRQPQPQTAWQGPSLPQEQFWGFGRRTEE